MKINLKFKCYAITLSHLCKACYTFKETLTALHTAIVPRCCALIVAHKENVHSEDVSSVLVNNVVRVNYITLGFTHLIAIRSKDKSLCSSLCIRFSCGNLTKIIEEMMPEARIDHMTCYVLHTAVIPVNREPILKLFFISKCISIVRINIAEIIP